MSDFERFEQFLGISFVILSDFERKGQGTGTAVPGILRDWSGTGTAVPRTLRDWLGTGTAVPPSLEGLGLQP